MPRKAKDKEDEVNKTPKKTTTKKDTKSTKKAESTSVKPVKKSTKTTTSSEKKTTSKTTKTKKSETLKKDTTKTETSKKKSPEKKVSSDAKKTTAKKTSTTRKKSSTKKSVVEYYDLPSVYNQTVVKVLAQTPSCLFVYWEVSDTDRLKFQKNYGDTFFEVTKPYLIITNETMNYNFEVEINDYANSWYIHINDSDCKYSVKLIRKSFSNDVSFVHSVDIISSNEMNAPNDHILFDKIGKTVFFRDVKTNVETQKSVSSFTFINNMGRIYNIYDLYKQIYHNELNGNELGISLSSSGFSSSFK